MIRIGLIIFHLTSMINIRCHVMGDIHRLNFNWNSLCDPRCLILLIFFAQEKCDDNNYNYNNNRRNNNGNNNHEIILLLIFTLIFTIFRLLDAWNIYLICRDFRIQAFLFESYDEQNYHFVIPEAVCYVNLQI